MLPIKQPHAAKVGTESKLSSDDDSTKLLDAVFESHHEAFLAEVATSNPLPPSKHIHLECGRICG